jgi:hypothetical protein
MLAGAFGELCATRLMEERLGELAQPYREGRAGAYSKAAKAATAAGATPAVVARRSPLLSRLAAALVLGGAVAERFSVFHAGTQSAADPRYVVMSQTRV